MLRVTLISLAFLRHAAAQTGPYGVWDHIQPNLRNGFDAYPGCPQGTPSKPADPSCIGAVTLMCELLQCLKALFFFSPLTPRLPRPRPRPRSHTLASRSNKAAFSEGGMYVVGWPTLAQAPTKMWAFDVVAWTWTPYSMAVPVTAAQADFQAADLFAWGGYVLSLGGGDDATNNQLAYISTTQGAGAQWTVAPVTGLSPHDAHRMVVFGGILYMVGGLTASDAAPTDPTKRIWSNAMWGLDLATYFAGAGATPQPPMAWSKLQSINAPGMFSPRGAFSIDVYSATIYVFGGLTRNPALPGGQVGSICKVAGALCQVFNDLWMYKPGLLNAPLSTATCSADQSANCGWQQVAVAGSVLPPARYGHASGVSSDHLYVFGGYDGSGNALTDLYAFNTDLVRAIGGRVKGCAPLLLLTSLTLPASSPAQPECVVPVHGHL